MMMRQAAREHATLGRALLPPTRPAEQFMAMPSRTRKRWTADEARRLNEENPRRWPRYEVIEGELLVTPAPRPAHQLVAQELLVRLKQYTDSERDVGQTLMSPADIALEPDSTVQPDVFVYPSGVRLRD